MRRLLRIVLLLGLAFVAASIVAVALYRVLPPPATPLMLLRAAQGYGLTKSWRSLSRSIKLPSSSNKAESLKS